MTNISASPRVVGIDVARTHLDLHLLPEGRVWRISYEPAQLHQLIGELLDRQVTLVVLEASGGYERVCADLLAEAGLQVAVVNPRQVRRFAGAMGTLAKTDAVDAAVIAQYGMRMHPEARHRPDPVRSRLTALVMRRAQLLAMRIAETQRANPAHLDAVVAADIAGLIDCLNSHIVGIEREIAQCIASHPCWSRLDAALRAVKSVGPQTATAMITLLPELGTISRRQIAALAGLAPINRDSGASRGRRSIQGGRSPVRTALYMAAITAARCHPTLAPFYLRLRERGKTTKTALIAVARKLLTILNAIARQTLQTA